MASLITRSSRICRFSCMSLYSSSLYIWRSPASKNTIDPPFNIFSSIHRVSDRQTVSGRGDVFGASSIFHRFFCSVPSSSQASPVSATAMDSDKTNKKSADRDSGKAEWSWKSKEFWKFVFFGANALRSFLIMMATGIVIYGGYQILRFRRFQENVEINRTGGKVIGVDGKTTIGCHFSLIDHNGKPVTDEDFHGMWKLIYFGFTHCPDVCPDEIQKLVDAVDMIKAKRQIDVLPIFISVDPERDGVEQVREYVKEFHPKLIGLTGSPEEIKKVARAYRVFYMKAQQEEDDYLVDHSIITFLMGPDMEFVKFFGKNDTVEGLADGVFKEIKKYKIKE